MENPYETQNTLDFYGYVPAAYKDVNADGK